MKIHYNIPHYYRGCRISLMNYKKHNLNRHSIIKMFKTLFGKQFHLVYCTDDLIKEYSYTLNNILFGK